MRQNLFYVIKLPTNKIRRKNKKVFDENGLEIILPKNQKIFDMGKYSFETANANNEIISIGDNLVFYKLREYLGIIKTPDEIYQDIQDIRKEIKTLRKLPTSKENSIKIKQLNEKIIDILYIKDIINVKVTNKDHYEEIALSKFKMNGITYKRLCCGAGQMRRNTVTFVNEIFYDRLTKELMCGLHDRIDKMILAKFSAYFALSFSSVLWVRKPRICVVSDFETMIPKQKIDYVFIDKNGQKNIEERVMDLFLNSCDGEGLISPKCAQWFSEDMGLDYTACQFIVRSAFVKGCLLTFDFADYAKSVCGVSKIKSIYGEEFNIDEIDVILTESQFKMHKYYKSCKEYQEYHDAYNLKWGVARYNKKIDDKYSLLNYQYIQNNNLSDKDIEDLIEPTIEWFQKICSGDKLYSLLYSIGCSNQDTTLNEIIESCGSIHTKAISQNSEMLNDGYIQKKIYESIKESFRQSKIGRIWAMGGYQFMLSDPIPLIRNSLGLDATGLIPANHIYSMFWNNHNHDELDLCRSPMVDRHEHNIVKTVQNKEMDKWYKYLYSGIIYSIYDTSTIRHSDSDFDGDLVFSTNNENLIKGAYRNNNPITYEKSKAPEQEFTYENIVSCDLNGFDTLVGKITNNSTSINAMLPNFPKEKYPEQYNELIKRLKLLREIIGAEIDKIKLGVAPEFPKDWLERVKINDTDSDIIKAIKYKHNSLVINKKAYFMVYLYDTLDRSYRNHIRQFDLDCKNKFNMSYKDLKFLKNKTKSQKKFIKKAEYFSPVLDTTCVMNKICHRMENIEKNIKYNKNINVSILPSFTDKNFILDKSKFEEMKIIYKEFKAKKKFDYLKFLMEDSSNKDEFFEILSIAKKNLCKNYKEKCTSNVSSNINDVFQYMLAVAKEYETNEQLFDFSFIWEVLDDDILEIIPKENSLKCIEHESGKEYLGKNYVLVEVE